MAALEEIASWPGAGLSETELPSESPRTINVPWPVLLLPIVRRLKKKSRRESLDAAPPPAAAAKTGKKILVVDDTEMLLVFVADVLATADQTLQIMTAPPGAEGMRLAASERPDLVLLDYSLTDMTGDKVCHALLENPATARIPVLMMSGHLAELARTARELSKRGRGVAETISFRCLDQRGRESARCRAAATCSALDPGTHGHPECSRVVIRRAARSNCGRPRPTVA